MISTSLFLSCIVFLLIAWIAPELIAHLNILKKFNIDDDDDKVSKSDSEIQSEPIDPIVLLTGQGVEALHYLRRAFEININYNRFVIIIILTLVTVLISLVWPIEWVLFLSVMGIQLTVISLLWLLESPISFGTSFLEKKAGFGELKKMDMLKYMRFSWIKFYFPHERDVLTGLIFEPLKSSTNLSKYPEYLNCLQDVYQNRKLKFLDELNKKTSFLHRRLRMSFYSTFLIVILAFTSILWGFERIYNQSIISESGIINIIYYVLTMITTVGTGDIHSLGAGLLITILFLLNIILLLFGFLQFFGDTLRFRIELAFDEYLKFLNRLISETTVIRLLVIEDKLYDKWKWISERFKYSKSAEHALQIHKLKRQLDQQIKSNPNKPES